MPSTQSALLAAAAGIPVAFAGFLRAKYGPTVWNDLVKIKQGIDLMKQVNTYIDNGTSIWDIFEQHVAKTPDKTFILYEDESYTYEDMDKWANQMVRFIQHSGVLRCKDSAAIFMYNSPAFIALWLAFGKLGVKHVMINYNLKTRSLLHCIKSCDSKAVICGPDPKLLDALSEIMPDLQSSGVTVWVQGRERDVLPAEFSHFDYHGFPSDPVSRDLRKEQTLQDVSSYIFTSGTTGLPKPCNVYNFRQITASFIQAPINLGPDDTIYLCLPLYHSAGLAVGFVNILRVGGTAAISKHFSVHKFWDEVRKFKTTVIQYIGETCRYLLAQPPHPDDGKYDHVLRVAIGNGLRPDIWEEFQRRFNVQTIAEFFGATEANGFTMNFDGKVGAVGRYTPLFRSLLDTMDFIQCDPVTAEPIRDKEGMCILVPPGKPGLLVFRVTDKAPLTGYKASKEVNDKKVLHDVKRKGDLYFNTGDLLSYDKDGYLYFVDRLGDTFRWKGENVATTEVAQTLNLFPGIQEANIYGVKVPGNMDGRAGMAAIVLHNPGNFDMKKFYQYVVKNLPNYACPKFIRIMPEMHITGTFKHRKTDLVKQGFDPNLVSDPLYFMDYEHSDYVPLTEQVLRRIVAGQAKL